MFLHCHKHDLTLYLYNTVPSVRYICAKVAWKPIDLSNDRTQDFLQSYFSVVFLKRHEGGFNPWICDIFNNINAESPSSPSEYQHLTLMINVAGSGAVIFLSTLYLV